MVSRRTLLTAIAVVNLADLVILIVLTWARGWPVVAFALSGFVLSVAYTAPPVRLKKRGLGEPDVLVVWGPLMVCGTYYSAVGSVGWDVLLASLPYGLLCTTVLMGKHIDKIPYDEPLGIRTLPVIFGEARARAVTLGMMVGFYLLVVAAVWPRRCRGRRCSSRWRCPGWSRCGRISAARRPTSRRPNSRCGHCGTPRWPGCTFAKRVPCWWWAWRSARCCLAGSRPQYFPKARATL